MNQHELSSAIGVSFQQIHKYESGVNRISASRLVDVARAMNVPPSYFFDGLASEHEAEYSDPEHRLHREAALLIRYYAAMPEAARKQFRALLGDLGDKD